MKQIFIFFATAIFIVAFMGCNDDNTPVDDTPPFSGKDNYISSFVLTVDGISYKASITDDRILVEIPYNVNLKGAKATYTLS